MHLYLTGPMTHIAQFNYPAFAKAATKLRELGYTIRSPAEADSAEMQAYCLASLDGEWVDPIPQSFQELMAEDVRVILGAEIDGVICMSGWERSRGSRLEVFTALTADKEHFLLFDASERVVPVGPDYFRYQLMRNMP